MTWMLFDWAGTLAFAVSGAMVGLSRRMDIFGVTVLALLLIVNFREMHQTKQAEKRDKALQKDGVKGGTR